MSKENDITVEVYRELGYKYLQNSATHDAMDPEKAAKKRAKLNKLIMTSFSSLPNGASIFEIGSGEGYNAAEMLGMGFDITGSDVSEDLRCATMEKGCKKVIDFNALKDDFPGKFHGIFCWRVFVHFNEDDALKVIKKAYDALEDGGVFIFNAINRETKPVDSEMVDFDNEYRMGADRFYYYHKKEVLDEFIAQTNFEIMDFHKEGGDEGKKWLIYVLRKPTCARLILKFNEPWLKINEVPRSGWGACGVPKKMVETVGAHTLMTQTYARSIYSEYKADYEDVNIDRVELMLLVHDVIEAETGDYMPGQISKEQKNAIEMKAMRKICKLLKIGNEIVELFAEFNEQKTADAKFAKQCDRVQCTLMAIRLGKLGYLTIERMKKMRAKTAWQRNRIKQVEESGLPLHIWWAQTDLKYNNYDKNFRSLVEEALKDE